MKTIIAGSRSLGVLQTEKALKSCPWQITEVVSGRAQGVDRAGEIWAEGRFLPIKKFPANWGKHGKSAGHIRNAEMADYADALVAVWDGQSNGTAGMIKQAQSKGIPVHIWRQKKIVVGCEFSGIVRDAFRREGHWAISVDLIPSERPGPHYEGSIEAFFAAFKPSDFDIMIGHPPCTYLTNAGSKHLYIGGRKENGRDEERWQKMRDAAQFFNTLLSYDVPRICVENPVMHCHAAELIAREYGQIIQPYEHGHPETKKTCLWLKNLPPLMPTNVIPPDYEKYPKGRGNGFEPRVHYESPGPDRWKNRSRTMEGVAKAMASQWSDL